MMDDGDDLVQRFPYECRTQWTWVEVADWCETNIGKFDQEWYRYGNDILAGMSGEPIYDHYRFRTEQQAILFRLRWS